MNSVLEFKGISKYFPGVKALDNICFKAYGGEVLAFLGENGAGKSTLLKVLNGDYQPTKGEYLLDGVQKHFHSPHEAIQEDLSGETDSSGTECGRKYLSGTYAVKQVWRDRYRQGE